MTESLATLADLLTRADFVVGFFAGLIGAILLYRILPDRRIPLVDAGLLTVAGALPGIYLTSDVGSGVVVGLGLLLVGGWGIGTVKSPWTISSLIGWLVVGAGSLVLASQVGVRAGLWVEAGVVMVTLVGGQLLRWWENAARSPYLSILVAVAAFGIWTTVPEADMARAFLGASLPMALASAIRTRTSKVQTSGMFVLAGTVAWLAAAGGLHRPASIIGGWACLALLVLLPAVLMGKRDTPRIEVWPLILGHGALVLIAARVIGLWRSGMRALIVILIGAILIPVLRMALPSDEVERARS